MRSLYRFEWKRSQKALLVWVLCQVGLILAGYVEYVFVFRNNADIPAIMNQMPPTVATMLGISSYVDFSDQAGFYCLMADFMFYVLTVYAALLGSGLFVREESGRTADFLYTRPMDRRTVALGKCAAGLTCCLELNLVTLLLSAVTFGLDSRVLPVVFLFALGSGLLQTVCFLAGMLFAALSRRMGTMLSLLFWLATVLGGKFLAMAGITSGPLMLLSFRDYFPAERWLFHTGASVWPWAVSAFWLVLLSAAAFRCHQRKDF